ncbi:hypothetical protein M5E06_10990 [Azospirillum sp. A1-3]|uniref:NACHT domain-containing protein n=1 Tax=Azospirillum sp. A1-3 TaxID=185874 RepID=UPI0020775205|nr:hypothetical protein [Azospirillum sp. A1-3]MCM8734717.1 hypothetical protein [Azospirillum sp. A1-3]
MKFVRNPDSKSARDLIEQVIRTESAKVSRLVERGAKSYFLLTNVSGSSHLESGSIDKANIEISNAFGIKVNCWWRDDIERRIDSKPAIKWSYPEIIRTTDLLQSLLAGNNDEKSNRRSDALRAYMAYQFKYDSQLKFKQIDLQKSLNDLFVDVPARLAQVKMMEKGSHWSSHVSGHEALFDESLSVSTEFNDVSEERLSQAPGALQLLIKKDSTKALSRLVLEGAPGQGKSTITQYLCQLYRMILLKRTSELSKIPAAHRPCDAMIPFRVDLRDYASWISGRDPFSDDSEARIPSGSSPVLECFLAAQVQRYTGMTFSVDDLTAVSHASQILIVLDGFDEVADISIRNRIVREASDAAVRIEENALSAQILVTSRPTAFANSPGFPRDEWQHMHLLSLSRSAIESYAQKWLDARGADAKEKRDTIRALKSKLDQAHVRDLARNPMQLAILLNLISVQGASLPNKRTALYDKYIDIFLNRESEKSDVVRDRRELLIQIHRHLAWILQVEAETKSGSGHIAESRLRETLRKFLESGGHGTSLVDDLFTGMVERVVALVSRVQGTFEFEVQPLREYFAARYLYDTAPYTPTGVQRRGTLPDRFDAIIRNFYWLNVARFYAGCYSSGELASLLDGLEEIEDSEQFKCISHVPEFSETV